MIEYDDNDSDEAQTLSNRLTSAGAKVTLIPTSRMRSSLESQSINYCDGANLAFALEARNLAETRRGRRDGTSIKQKYKVRSVSRSFCEFYSAPEGGFDLVIVLRGP